ncbi:MAG: hypothetical protein Q6353_017060 [Candidatus Sigynarchaeum springense]
MPPWETCMGTKQQPGVERGKDKDVVAFRRKPTKTGVYYIIWIPRAMVRDDVVDPGAEYDVFLRKQLGAAIETVVAQAHALLAGNAVPGKALVSPADTARPCGPDDSTAGLVLTFQTGGKVYELRLSVTANDDGTLHYLMGAVKAKNELAAPMVKAFWSAFQDRTLKSHAFLDMHTYVDGEGKVRVLYFHMWLGCINEKGSMYELDEVGKETEPQRKLSGGGDGEVAYIMRRRATLEHFLSFLSGAQRPSEQFWISKNLGVARLLAEYDSLHQAP